MIIRDRPKKPVRIVDQWKWYLATLKSAADGNEVLLTSFRHTSEFDMRRELPNAPREGREVLRDRR